MKYYLVILILTLIGCNSNRHSGEDLKDEPNKCFVYPREIDSLQLGALYDSARWLIYTIQCDEKYLPMSDTTKSIPFGELALQFENLNVRHDTLDINFRFMDKEKPILFSMNRSNKSIISGVGFNIKSKNKLYMIFPGGNVTYKGKGSRYENSLQPAVVSYIKGNWNKMNECFRNLAERKGLNQH